MITINVSEMRASIGDMISKVAYGGERLLLRKGKRDMAAVVPLEDLKRLEELDQESDLAAYRKAKKRYKASGRKSVPLDDLFSDSEQ